jgi:uncharacterized protein (DUF1330 family)
MAAGIWAEDGGISRETWRQYLVRGGAMERLEGTGPLPGVLVVLEFPSMEHARAWYHDPEYAPLITLRQTGSDLDFILVEGV